MYTRQLGVHVSSYGGSGDNSIESMETNKTCVSPAEHMVLT